MILKYDEEWEQEDLLKCKGIISDIFYNQDDDDFGIWLDNRNCVIICQFIFQHLIKGAKQIKS